MSLPLLPADIYSFLQRYTTVPHHEWLVIAACFKPQVVAKGTLLLREGDVCRDLFFLEKGLMHYFTNTEGIMITRFFTIAPYMFTSVTSFTKGKPATESIQAIEKSIVWRVSYRDANELLNLNSWSTFVRELLFEVQANTAQILEDLQTCSAQSRYADMLTNTPDLLQRIPLKHLAAYLGITPQSLSRIRRKMTSANRS